MRLAVIKLYASFCMKLSIDRDAVDERTSAQTAQEAPRGEAPRRTGPARRAARRRAQAAADAAVFKAGSDLFHVEILNACKMFMEEGS